MALLVLAALGCAARRNTGSQCAYAADCPTPLVCMVGLCRAQCTTDRDCPVNTFCVESATPTVRVCASAEQPLCQTRDDCMQSAGVRLCVQGQCVPQCQSNTDCATFSERAVCGASGSCELPASERRTRPTAPLSTSAVSSQRPTLRWRVGTMDVAPTGVRLCRDRAMSTGCLEGGVTLSGTSARPDAPLAAGLWYWQLTVPGRAGSTATPVWQLRVPARASTVDLSYGAEPDFDGDGLAELVVGAPGAAMGAGRAHLYRGRVGGASATPTQSFSVTEEPGFGLTLGSAGDLDGDGFPELAVSATNLTQVGRVYVFRGGPSGVSATASVVLVGPDGGNGAFGWSVGSAGDVNGDGYGDLAVGALGANRLHLYYGGEAGVGLSPSVSLTRPNARTDLDFGGGFAAVDLDGDGYSDLAVSASRSNTNAGRVFVYRGSAGGPPAMPSLTLAAPEAVPQQFGWLVGNAGDVNGDGYQDLLVGAPRANTNSGRAYLYLGGAQGLASAPAVTLATPDGQGSFFGASGATVGDVNGDGLADVLLGAYGTSAAVPGRAHLYLGTPAGLGAAPARSFTGTEAGAQLGIAMGTPGDHDGDGRLDVVLAANHQASNTGQVELYPGGATSLALSASLTLRGPDGPEGRFGLSVAHY